MNIQPNKQMTKEEKYNALQMQSKESASKLLAYRLEIESKYGMRCYLALSHCNKSERSKEERLARAADKAWDKFFSLVESLGGYDWNTDVPVWRIREQLTFSEILAGKDACLRALGQQR